MSFTPLCFLSSFCSLPHPQLNPNSLSFPLCCSCQTPPASSISPSPLAFSREVIHGIALPQGKLQHKNTLGARGHGWGEQGRQGHSQTSTQAAGKRPRVERENCWGSPSSWCGHSYGSHSSAEPTCPGFGIWACPEESCQQGWCQHSQSHSRSHQSHLVSDLGDGNRCLSPFKDLSCSPKSSLFWFFSLSVLGQGLLVSAGLQTPNSAGLEMEGRKQRKRKRTASSSGLRNCSITQLRRQEIPRESRSQDTNADEVGSPVPTTFASTGLPVSPGQDARQGSKDQ